MENDLPTPRTLVRIAVIVEGGLAVLAVALGWLLGCPPVDEIHWTAAGLATGAAASVPLLGLLWVCVRAPFRPFTNLMRVVDEMLVPMFRHCGAIELAVISLLAGVGEEMLFRGVIQEVVADWVGGQPGVWIGLAVAALLFAVAHLITPTYALLAGLMGLYLGGLWIYTDNLLVPITTHATYDFLALVYLAKFRDPLPENPPS